MKKQPVPTKYVQVLAVAFLLLFAGVACLPAAVTPISTPIIQVVEVNREVTRVVVREVTRVVQVPVTVTPSAATDTPAPTQTPTGAVLPTIAASPTAGPSPTSGPTPVPPDVSMLIHTECLYGPSTVYLGRYELQAGSAQAVIGRNLDGTWVAVKGSDHTNPCWVKATIVKVNSGSLETVPVIQPDLSPYSTLYPPPPAVSANRVGNDVTVFWIPVPMAEADYQGYLIEAWVCQGGKQVFVAQTKATSFDDTVMKALKFTDEPSCVEPSSARIYSVSKQGYSTFKKILPWPTPAPAATP